MQKFLAVNLVFLVVISLAGVLIANPQNNPAPENPEHPGKSYYGRGVGTPQNVCGENEEKDGALCYRNCDPAYNGVGPVCWEKCKSDEKDHGATCFRSIIKWRFKKSHGRGGGRVPKGCPDGKEPHQALCYTPCKQGYKGVGPICYYVGF
ncbi:hypothetical protein BKA69DRAFT_1168840 [Paraphysoderma sedebokerense]|nr:hypothetical protein BKA69DRAFT_1168840 [Paraphysoderma sedebokerense]